MKTIPQKYHVFYWDTNPEKLDLIKHKKYIIERILEYGDLEADRWLDTIYNKNEIIEVVKNSRRLSLKTVNLYSLKYNLNRADIECFRNPYTQKQNRF